MCAAASTLSQSCPPVNSPEDTSPRRRTRRHGTGCGDTPGPRHIPLPSSSAAAVSPCSSPPPRTGEGRGAEGARVEADTRHDVRRLRALGTTVDAAPSGDAEVFAPGLARSYPTLRVSGSTRGLPRVRSQARVSRPVEGHEPTMTLGLTNPCCPQRSRRCLSCESLGRSRVAERVLQAAERASETEAGVVERASPRPSHTPAPRLRRRAPGACRGAPGGGRGALFSVQANGKAQRLKQRQTIHFMAMTSTSRIPHSPRHT